MIIFLTLSEHNLTFLKCDKIFVDLLHYYKTVPVVNANFDSNWPLEFYREYVAKNQPVLIKGGCRHFPAVKKWNSEYFK